MFRPRFYLAPDEGAGAGAPAADTDPSEGQSTETPPAPGDTGAETAPGAPETAPGDTGQDGALDGAEAAPDSDDAPVDVEAIKRSLQGVSRERSQFKAEADDFKAKYEEAQAELQRLKDRPYTPPASADVPPASQDSGNLRDAKEINPMLDGLKFDPADGLVWIDGAWQSPKAAMSIRYMEGQIAAQQEASQRAEAQKKQEASQQIISSAQSTVVSECAKRFSGVSESAMQMITPSVMAAVGADLAAKGIDLSNPASLPADFPAIFGGSVAGAIKNAKAALAELQNPQTLANKQAAEEQPVGADGRPAVPGVKSFENLDPAGQHKATVGMVDKIRARLTGQS